MKDLLLNVSTRKQLDKFSKDPVHALLLYGEQGSGKKFTAYRFAQQIIGYSGTKDDQKITVIKKLKDKQEIGIEQIRELSKSLHLKINSQSGVDKVFIVEEADSMGHEAQNALLKTLEESQANSLIILTASSPSSLLPTISSRCQHIEIKPISLSQASEYFNTSYTQPKISSAFALSGGCIGLMSAILSQDSEHDLKLAVDQAKQYIRMNNFEKSRFLSKISDKKELNQFVIALQKINKALSASPGASSAEMINITQLRSTLLEVQKATNSGSNLKLTSLRLLVGR